MSIELVPLCTMRLQSKPAVEVGTGPAGTRLIVDCTSVDLQGDRLRGRILHGRLDGSDGLKTPLTCYVAPRFETGDERYAWLNRIQAVGKGTIDQDGPAEDISVDFEWYELR